MSTAAVQIHTGEPGTAIERVERSPERDATLAPMTFEQMLAMGDQLVRTGFLPDHIKNGGQAAAIILTGRELGMPPMRAIRSLQMVKGKVVESADSQLARFKREGGHAAFRRLDEEGAVLFLRHPNGDEHEESFTSEDAQAAGLLGKEMYGKFRKAMLRSRAITAGLKSIGWEGGVGNYDPDEAIAFSGGTTDSPASAVRVERNERDERDKQDAQAPELTLDVALAMPLPGSAKAFGGKGGTPLGELSGKMLESIAKWLATKIGEDAESGADEDSVKVRTLAAIKLIVEQRGGREVFPASAATSASAAAAPDTSNAGTVNADGTIAAPGTHASAMELREGKAGKAAPTSADESVVSLTKRITTLLADQKLDESERALLRKRLAGANDTAALLQLLADVEETISSLPF